jgi:hypothetical protein
MIKSYLILFILSISSLQAFSQKILEGNHFAVNEKGDTLRGFIEEIGETKITIASIRGGEYKVLRLSTKTIKEYTINDTLYRRIPINLKQRRSEEAINSTALTTRVFLKSLIYGPVSLYERNMHRLKLLDTDSNDDAKGFLYKMPVNEWYVHYDEKLPALMIDENNFYMVASKAMGHKKRIKERLNSGYYSFQNLDQLILDYNYLVIHNIE